MSILIKVRNNDIMGALRILKKKMNDEGVLTDLKKHEYYRSPSLKRREKHKAALKRINKQKAIKEAIENNTFVSKTQKAKAKREQK